MNITTLYWSISLLMPLSLNPLSPLSTHTFHFILSPSQFFFSSHLALALFSYVFIFHFLTSSSSSSFNWYCPFSSVHPHLISSSWSVFIALHPFPFCFITTLVHSFPSFSPFSPVFLIFKQTRLPSRPAPTKAAQTWRLNGAMNQCVPVWLTSKLRHHWGLSLSPTPLRTLPTPPIPSRIWHSIRCTRRVFLRLTRTRTWWLLHVVPPAERIQKVSFYQYGIFYPLTHLPLPYGLSLQVCDTSFWINS